MEPPGPYQRGGMHVALISPLSFTVPPKFYGSIERVVDTLAEGLVERGFEVTLFAAAGSTTSADLVPTWPEAIEQVDEEDRMGLYTYSNCVAVEKVAERLGSFDIVHSHVHEFALPLCELTDAPVVATVHEPVERQFQRRAFQCSPKVHLVALTDSQRRPCPELHWCATIHNSVDTERMPFQPNSIGGYLLFVGRMTPQKDPAAAIDIAQAAGARLILAAPTPRFPGGYFDDEVAPRLNAYPRATFIGEVDENTKIRLYRNARALLAPISWAEPFGLVFLEALAAGTPVIVRNRGSAAEIIEHGLSGFVGETNEDLVAAVARIDELDRQACRDRAMRFTTAKMIDDHVNLYERLYRGECAFALMGVCP